MCTLYSLTTTQKAIIALIVVLREIERIRDKAGNVPPLPGIFPDYAAPTVRNGAGGVLELAMSRWGMPSPRSVLEAAAQKRADRMRAKGGDPDMADLVRMEPDPGVVNVRNVGSPHWRRWLGPESRCLVPFNSFAEPELLPDGRKPPAWFALSPDRPLAFFAGIHTTGWRSVRKVKEGEVTADHYAFLTTDANQEVAALHPKAMPVILTRPEEWEAWLSEPWEDARRLQRPLPDGSLQIVARGEKEDPPTAVALS